LVEAPSRHLVLQDIARNPLSLSNVDVRFFSPGFWRERFDLTAVGLNVRRQRSVKEHFLDNGPNLGIDTRPG
jgi:hypothetical protein